MNPSIHDRIAHLTDELERVSSTAQAVPLIGAARLPDCIMGRDTQ